MKEDIFYVGLYVGLLVITVASIWVVALAMAMLMRGLGFA